MSNYLIGLTGNIATGKSTVAKMLADLGATVIDADALVHELERKGTAAYDAIVAVFGPGILDQDGELDRAALGAIVFSDPVKLQRLESIVHPAVLLESMRRIGEAVTPVVVYEAIKLIEAGRAEMCDAIWVVWDHDRLVAERRLQLLAAGGLQLTRVVLVDVIGILQQVTGQYGHHIGVAGDHAGRGQLPDACECRG